MGLSDVLRLSIPKSASRNIESLQQQIHRLRFSNQQLCVKILTFSDAIFNSKKLVYAILLIHLFCSGIINLLFDGLTYNTRGHFSSPLRGSEKLLHNSRKYPRVLYAKSSKKM